MAASPATAETRQRDPDLPPLVKVGELIAPKAPQDIAGSGLEEGVLTGLILKLAYTVARFTTDYVSKNLHLSPALTNALLEKLCFEGLIEQLWQTTQASSHYKITDHGKEHAG